MATDRARRALEDRARSTLLDLRPQHLTSARRSPTRRVIGVEDGLVADTPPPLRRRVDRGCIGPCTKHWSRRRIGRDSQGRWSRDRWRGRRSRLVIPTNPQDRQYEQAREQRDKAQPHTHRASRTFDADRVLSHLCIIDAGASVRLGAPLRRSPNLLGAPLRPRSGARTCCRLARLTGFPRISGLHSLAVVLKAGLRGKHRHGSRIEGTRILAEQTRTPVVIACLRARPSAAHPGRRPRSRPVRLRAHHPHQHRPCPRAPRWLTTPRRCVAVLRCVVDGWQRSWRSSPAAATRPSTRPTAPPPRPPSRPPPRLRAPRPRPRAAPPRPPTAPTPRRRPPPPRPAPSSPASPRDPRPPAPPAPPTPTRPPSPRRPSAPSTSASSPATDPQLELDLGG